MTVFDDVTRDLFGDAGDTRPPFARTACQYRRLGWWPIPLPPTAKKPPPTDMTGTRTGRPPTVDQVEQWIKCGQYQTKKGPMPVANIALRMPPDVIGIDVDDGYSKDGVAKVGARSLVQLEAAHGDLPRTVSSTARGWGESRIRFYRVPAGWRLKAAPADSIEVVQHHHRYAVVWPSQHPDAGVYFWYNDVGDILDEPPDPADLPDLPWPWLEALRSTGDHGSRSVPATPERVGAFYDDACGNAKPDALKGLGTLLERQGSRHDHLVEAACMAAREAFAGWYPMAQAEQLLRGWWDGVMDDPRRLDGPEFDDAIAWAIAQVDPTSEQVKRKVAEAKRARMGAGAATSPIIDSPAKIEEKKSTTDAEGETAFDGQFFRKGVGLLHATLRDAVEEGGPLAAGPGRSLWRYTDGVWLIDGDDEVRRRVSRLLGQRHRRSHAEGIVDDLRSREPFISDEPERRWINVRNGLLDWMTGELQPHSAEVPSTYQLTVGWQPSASCPTVDAWLADVAPPDAIELVWEVIGISIYADMPVHRAVLLVGPGRNGKGTLLRLVKALIGARHISAITLQGLAERFAAAELFGKVANIAGDIDARSITRTDIFKMATGGDTIAAERKHGQPFTFTNRATMLFSANELPGSLDLSDGFFSRWIVVPFDRLRLEPGQEDPTLEPRMHAELEGVLVRAVDGLRRVLVAGGFSRPQSVAEASAAYRQYADPILRFVEECMAVTGDDNHRSQRSSVYAAYRSWCDTNGHKPFAAAKFYERLAGAFPQVNARTKSMGIRYVSGAYLVTEERF